MVETPGQVLGDCFTDYGSHECSFSDLSIKGAIDTVLAGRGTQIKTTRKVILQNCEFKDSVSLFAHENIQSKIEIINSTFNAKCTLNIETGWIKITESYFKNGLVIVMKEGKLELEGATLQGHVKLSGGFFSIKCTSIKMENADNTEFKCSFNVVKNEADFSNSHLVNATFAGSSFLGKASFFCTQFENTNPDKILNFAACYFKQSVDFDKANLSTKISFNSSKFDESLSLYAVNQDVATQGEFLDTQFMKKVHFDNSKWNSLKLQHNQFMELVSFKSAKIESLNIAKPMFKEGTDFLHADITYGDRETFRIIKNEFLKINNQVESMHFRAKEMDAYKEELSKKKQYGELSLVWLNKISNSHGLSWIQGLKFTLLTALFFYCIYLATLSQLPFQWGFKSWDSFWQATGINIKYFIRFLIVTHDIDFMEKYKPSALSFIIDFVGKVFIGYGIYQTIQAFRKHGKS